MKWVNIVCFIFITRLFLMLWNTHVHLHGPSCLPVVNYFSIMTVATHIMTAVKESGFFSHLSYQSASSPVTYQPQRIRLLSDVNVFQQTISLLINTTNGNCRKTHV